MHLLAGVFAHLVKVVEADEGRCEALGQVGVGLALATAQLEPVDGPEHLVGTVVRAEGGAAHPGQTLGRLVRDHAVLVAVLVRGVAIWRVEWSVILGFLEQLTSQLTETIADGALGKVLQRRDDVVALHVVDVGPVDGGALDHEQNLRGHFGDLRNVPEARKKNTEQKRKSEFHFTF